MEWLIDKFCVFTGYRFWYQIKYQFVDKRGHIVGYKYIKVGITKKRYAIEARKLNKIIGKDEYKDNRIHGTTIELVVLSYIGFARDRT